MATNTADLEQKIEELENQVATLKRVLDQIASLASAQEEESPLEVWKNVFPEMIN